MDIVRRLKEEHEELQAAFTNLMSSEIDDPEAYGRSFVDLMIALESHERAEEQTIYAQLGSDLDIRPIALQSMEEHRIARLLMRELADVEITEEVWIPKLVVANNIVSLHIQIEEGNVFAIIEQLFDEDMREKLDRDFEMVHRSTVLQLRS
jgi:hemerythrin superfamily protein